MNALQRGVRPQKDRQGVRRAVVLMPNGLTLFNLFCGIYAIILAIRLDFANAPAFIVLGGIADTLDGRVARATGTGSRFGEELDSLVDAISFGFAPALIVYLGALNHGTWEWLLVFIFTACAVMRLARFNVEQAGRKKTHFHGLPSPAAGLTLATYYWFAQTPLYNQTVILFTDSKTLSDLPWANILRGLMAILAALMISDVPYPTVPSIGFTSIRRVLGTLVVTAAVVLVVARREEFLFPALLAYVLYGVLKWVILGLLGRSSTPDEVFGTTSGGARVNRPPGARLTPPVAQPVIEAARDERVRDERRRDDSEPSDERRPADGQPQRRKRRRRRGGSNRPHGSNPPGPPLPDLPTDQAE
jgi:CDP-diacylglycerol---serine O-phosphatidyltransferase